MAWGDPQSDLDAANAAADAVGGGWGGAPGPAGAGYGGGGYGGMSVGSGGYNGPSSVGGGAYGGGPVGGASVGGPAMGSSAASTGAAQAASNVSSGPVGSAISAGPATGPAGPVSGGGIASAVGPSYSGGLSAGSSSYGGPSTAGGYGQPQTGPSGPVGYGGGITSAANAGQGPLSGGIGGAMSGGYGNYGGYQGAGPGSEGNYGGPTGYGGGGPVGGGFQGNAMGSAGQYGGGPVGGGYSGGPVGPGASIGAASQGGWSDPTSSWGGGMMGLMGNQGVVSDPAMGVSRSWQGPMQPVGLAPNPQPGFTTPWSSTGVGVGLQPGLSAPSPLARAASYGLPSRNAYDPGGIVTAQYNSPLGAPIEPETQTQFNPLGQTYTRDLLAALGAPTNYPAAHPSPPGLPQAQPGFGIEGLPPGYNPTTAFQDPSRPGVQPGLSAPLANPFAEDTDWASAFSQAPPAPEYGLPAVQTPGRSMLANIAGTGVQPGLSAPSLGSVAQTANYNPGSLMGPLAQNPPQDYGSTGLVQGYSNPASGAIYGDIPAATPNWESIVNAIRQTPPSKNVELAPGYGNVTNIPKTDPLSPEPLGRPSFNPAHPAYLDTGQSLLANSANAQPQGPQLPTGSSGYAGESTISPSLARGSMYSAGLPVGSSGYAGESTIASPPSLGLTNAWASQPSVPAVNTISASFAPNTDITGRPINSISARLAPNTDIEGTPNNPARIAEQVSAQEVPTPARTFQQERMSTPKYAGFPNMPDVQPGLAAPAYDYNSREVLAPSFNPGLGLTAANPPTPRTPASQPFTGNQLGAPGMFSQPEPSTPEAPGFFQGLLGASPAEAAGLPSGSPPTAPSLPAPETQTREALPAPSGSFDPGAEARQALRDFQAAQGVQDPAQDAAAAARRGLATASPAQTVPGQDLPYGIGVGLDPTVPQAPITEVSPFYHDALQSLLGPKPQPATQTFTGNQMGAPGYDPTPLSDTSGGYGRGAIQGAFGPPMSNFQEAANAAEAARLAAATQQIQQQTPPTGVERLTQQFREAQQNPYGPQVLTGPPTSQPAPGVTTPQPGLSAPSPRTTAPAGLPAGLLGGRDRGGTWPDYLAPRVAADGGGGGGGGAKGKPKTKAQKLAELKRRRRRGLSDVAGLLSA